MQDSMLVNEIAKLLESHDVVDRAFEISPDTVYGFLVGGFVIVISVMAGAIRFLYKDFNEKIAEERAKNHESEKELRQIHKKSAAFLQELLHAMDSLNVESREGRDELKGELKVLGERLIDLRFDITSYLAKNEGEHEKN